MHVDQTEATGSDVYEPPLACLGCALADTIHIVSTVWVTIGVMMEVEVQGQAETETCGLAAIGTLTVDWVKSDRVDVGMDSRVTVGKDVDVRATDEVVETVV
jgi:hypothetical protein